MAVLPSRSRRAFLAVVAALAVVVTLASCGSAPLASSSQGQKESTSSTAASPSTAMLPGTDGPIDGAEVQRLPKVPAARTARRSPDLSTEAAQATFLHGVFTDVQGVWDKAFTAAGLHYSPARLVLFRSVVETACGTENASVGPFYCSGDHSVYLDIRFFSALHAQFGVGGAFAEAYVVAHELGHHIQNLVGITSRVAAATQASPSQANALSVMVELQADCFAGVWAHSAYERDLLDPGDIEEALHAAEVVGDDFLAHVGRASVVDPDTWTHGSSAQRQHWFVTGYNSGSPDACDTFAGL